MRCANCNTKITEKSMLSNGNKLLDKESTVLLNGFLPEEYQSESYCDYCLDTISAETSVINKHRYKYLPRILNELENFKKELNVIEAEKNEKKINLFKEFESKIKLYSNTPKDIKEIEFVESFIVVDSGMWSTSSDNLDAMWSAIHDNVARAGNNTNKLIKDGFESAKSLIKREAFLKEANCVINLSFKFSDLAGNGKILIFAQGTAAFDSTGVKFKLDDIDNSLNDDINEINTLINEYENILVEKSFDNLYNLIQSLPRNN